MFYCNTDGRNAVVFYLLHALMPPTTKEVTRDSDKKSHVKRFTLKDSQNSFMTMHTTLIEWEEHIAHLSQRQSTIQPMISLIGESLLDPKEIFVYFEGVKFKFFNIIKAIDICFKIFFVFNFKFPLASQAVWQFIDSYFYKVSDKPDIHTNVKLLLSTLKNEKKNSIDANVV